MQFLYHGHSQLPIRKLLEMARASKIIFFDKTRQDILIKTTFYFFSATEVDQVNKAVIVPVIKLNSSITPWAIKQT